MSLYSAGLEHFLAGAGHGWQGLDFFAHGAASAAIAQVDARVAAGASVLPAPQQVFAALEATPLAGVRAVILGQDPYPTPGDAHGLAFSYRGARRLPASLKNIFRELADDLQTPLRTRGDLGDWAGQGVLLLNTALTVEAGCAGAHLKLGWQPLADDIMRRLAARPGPCAFILWGDRARQYAPLVTSAAHLVVASPHPSPLSAYRGFFGSRPFSRANEHLAAHGLPAINWG